MPPVVKMGDIARATISKPKPLKTNSRLMPSTQETRNTTSYATRSTPSGKVFAFRCKRLSPCRVHDRQEGIHLQKRGPRRFCGPKKPNSITIIPEKLAESKYSHRKTPRKPKRRKIPTYGPSCYDRQGRICHGKRQREPIRNSRELCPLGRKNERPTPRRAFGINGRF